MLTGCRLMLAHPEAGCSPLGVLSSGGGTRMTWPAVPAASSGTLRSGSWLRSWLCETPGRASARFSGLQGSPPSAKRRIRSGSGHPRRPHLSVAVAVPLEHGQAQPSSTLPW